LYRGFSSFSLGVSRRYVPVRGTNCLLKGRNSEHVFSATPGPITFLSPLICELFLAVLKPVLPLCLSVTPYSKMFWRRVLGAEPFVLVDVWLSRSPGQRSLCPERCAGHGRLHPLFSCRCFLTLGLPFRRPPPSQIHKCDGQGGGQNQAELTFSSPLNWTLPPLFDVIT